MLINGLEAKPQHDHPCKHGPGIEQRSRDQCYYQVTNYAKPPTTGALLNEVIRQSTCTSLLTIYFTTNKMDTLIIMVSSAQSSTATQENNPVYTNYALIKHRPCIHICIYIYIFIFIDGVNESSQTESKSTYYIHAHMHMLIDK